MSTFRATGFCRVTVVASGSRVDVALPEDVALADLNPEILGLTGRTQPPDEPAGWHLVRRDGTVLDPSRTLADQRVLDGEVLSLRPFAGSLPPVVYDDVADAVSLAAGRDPWGTGTLRAVCLTVAAALFLLLAFVLWSSDPARHDTHGLPALVAGVAGALLTAWSVARARVHRDRGSAAVLGICGLPLLLVAGAGITSADPGRGPGRLQFLLGCVLVLLASTTLIVLTPRGTPRGDAPFVASTVAAGTGTLAAFAAVLTGAAPASAAAVCAVTATCATAFLPALSVRLARLPVGYDPARPSGEDPVDAARVASRAHRAHELLLGLVGGVAPVVAVSGAVLGLSHSPWTGPLCVATGLAAAGRARLFRRTPQIVGLLLAGLVPIVLLAARTALDSPPGRLLAGHPAPGDGRALWLAAAVTAGALAVTAIGLTVPRVGVPPLWGRLLDLADAAVLLCLVPLCLGVLGVYAAVRGMT